MPHTRPGRDNVGIIDAFKLPSSVRGKQHKSRMLWCKITTLTDPFPSLLWSYAGLKTWFATITSIPLSHSSSYLLSSLPSSLGSYDSWIVEENVSPTFFIVIPRSGRGNWLAAVKPRSLPPLQYKKEHNESVKNQREDALKMMFAF